MTYPGGKAGAGVWQRIINQMPPHRLYVEPFVGAGAVLRAKRPAERWCDSIGRMESLPGRCARSCGRCPAPRSRTPNS